MMHRVLERQLRKVGIGDEPPTADQWTQLVARIDRAYQEADQDRYTLERALELSSEEMKTRFAELRSAQRQLVEASRKAGKVDVAVSVLHNIGNVLNSVNVSTNIVSELVKNSALSKLEKSLALLVGQSSPGKFLEEDARGKKLLPYLTAVEKALVEERVSVTREMEALTRHVEHIKTIVSQQLASARGDARPAKIFEQVILAELLEDAVSVLRSTLNDQEPVEIAQDVDSVVVDTDRHKVFQIVMNLLANARDAIAERAVGGTIQVRGRRALDGKFAIEVEDNGIGIAKGTIEKLFTHGFTTKPDGHGFGLHACACAAMELGGTLSARSDGCGMGSTFTLLLPTGRLSTKPSGRQFSLTPSRQGAQV